MEFEPIDPLTEGKLELTNAPSLLTSTLFVVGGTQGSEPFPEVCCDGKLDSCSDDVHHLAFSLI